MLSQRIIDRIEEVDSLESFNALLEAFKLSEAPLTLKEEAIRELKCRRSVYYMEHFKNTKELIKEILAGQADIDDIN